MMIVFVVCLLKAAVVSSISPFLANAPDREWKMVGYLDMSDPTQQCPDSWQKITSPRSLCGKKSTAPCDSLNISTSGATYQKVCGRFRGYQIGSTDAFRNVLMPTNIETYYVDGISVTYGSPGSRHHVFTYAAGITEMTGIASCPCTGGSSPPQFVGSDYYCESGNTGPGFVVTQFYSSDVLWDRQQCVGDEITCCNPPDLPWFCKTFSTPISEDLEIRICTDQGLNDENVGIESFELYIQVAISLMNIEVTSVFNPDNTLRHLEISWIPEVENETLYTIAVGDDSSVNQVCTVCTSSPCLYVHQLTHLTNNYSISVTAIKKDGSLGIHNSTTINRPLNSVIKNGSFVNFTSIGCSFLNNQSFYCVVCCSTDPSVPPDSSVYNISAIRGTEVTVSLKGLTSSQTYYCKAAASNTNSTHCDSPVVGNVKMYFMAILPPIPPLTTVTIPLMNIQAVLVFNPDNTLRQLEISWIPVEGNFITMYTVRFVGADSSINQVYTACNTSSCFYTHQVIHRAYNYNISVTSINQDGTLGSKNSTTFVPTNAVFENISSSSGSSFISCSFKNNQSFYCVVCCSTDLLVPPDSSVYNISTTSSTHVTVTLQGLTNGQMYHCKAAASNTKSTRCTGPVIGDVKVYFNIVPLTLSTPTLHGMSEASIDLHTLIGIIFTSSFGFISLVALVATCIGCMLKTRSKGSLQHLAPQSLYEMVDTDQKKITTIKLEANSAYELSCKS